MSFNWSKFLALAEQLATGDEASKRSAISRAYYSAFCSARDRLVRGGIYVPSTGEAHDRVPELYGYCGEHESQQIKMTLAREKIVRNSADYDVVFSGDVGGSFRGNLEKSTERSIERAEKTLKSVDKIDDYIIKDIKKNMR